MTKKPWVASRKDFENYKYISFKICPINLKIKLTRVENNEKLNF